jgi:hypothetical protein
MFMVKAMLGTCALGEYSLTVVLAGTVVVATDPVVLAFLPHQTANSVSEAALLQLRGVRVNRLLGSSLALGWLATGLFVIRVLFGPSFTAAYRTLVGLLPGIIFLAMQRPTGALLIRAARPGRIAAIHVPRRVVEHLEREVTVQLIREHIRRAPIVLVAVPSRFTRRARRITDERLYTRTEVCALVRQAGLRVLESFLYGGVPTNLARNLERGLPKVAYRGGEALPDLWHGHELRWAASMT